MFCWHSVCVVLGCLGEIHPAVAEAYELSGRVYVAELALPPPPRNI